MPLSAMRVGYSWPWACGSGHGHMALPSHDEGSSKSILKGASSAWEPPLASSCPPSGSTGIIIGSRAHTGPRVGAPTSTPAGSPHTTSPSPDAPPSTGPALWSAGSTPGHLRANSEVKPTSARSAARRVKNHSRITAAPRPTGSYYLRTRGLSDNDISAADRCGLGDLGRGSVGCRDSDGRKLFRWSRFRLRRTQPVRLLKLCAERNSTARVGKSAPGGISRSREAG